jgi:hypothetical protein
VWAFLWAGEAAFRPAFTITTVMRHIAITAIAIESAEDHVIIHNTGLAEPY